MPNDVDDLDELDGSTLRKKYEALIKESNTLRAENSKFKAKEVLETKGFTLVKPEDLEGVAPDKVEERAAELQEQRRGTQTELARDIFAAQGYEGDELEEAVEAFIAGRAPAVNQPDPDAARFAGVRALNREEARPVTPVNPSELHGREAIAHGIAQRAQKSKRAF